MKIENLNIFDRVNTKDQNAGSGARSSQGEDQKSSQDSSFAKLLSSDKKSFNAKSNYEKRSEAAERQEDNSYEQSSVEANRKPIPERAPVAVPRSVPVAKTGSEPVDETRKEDIRKPAKPLEMEVGGNQLTKRVAMQTFLKKMKDQLNVQPEQLMAAFSSLSIDELTNPPEMNLEKIIQGLNLSEQQQPIAKQLFEDMMKQTAADSMAEQLKASGQQLSLQVLSQKDIQQKELNQSLSKMNQNFFMAEQKPMLQNPVMGKAPQIANESQIQEQSFSDSGEGFEIPGFVPAQGKMPMTAANLAAQNPGVAAQNLASNGGEQAIENTAPKVAAHAEAKAAAAKAVPTEAVPLAAGQPVTPELLSAMMPQAKTTSASSFFMDNEGEDEAPMEIVDTAALKNSGLDTQQIEKLKAAIQAQASNNENSEAKKDGDLSAQDLGLSTQANQSKPAGFDKAMASQGLMNKQVSPGQDSANVKELINQAQFMIKKGGGEMKVRLTPEGLGEVAMKVNVKDGQVSVEMITETSDAKSLIEKGLGDLKATLASHRLNVDQIKVDLAHQTAKDFQQQHEQASRHQAQQFMEEFRQDNQQWRQSFYDVPGAKAYKSQTRDEADNSYLTPQSARKSSAASRRLDLVA